MLCGKHLLQWLRPISCHWSAESQRQAQQGQRGQKHKHVIFKWTAKLVITAQRQWVFHSVILYLYIKY